MNDLLERAKERAEYCESKCRSLAHAHEGSEPCVECVALAIEETERDATERAAKLAEISHKAGPGGIDMTGGIPSEIYVGIGRDHYEDEYELAIAVAQKMRDCIAAAIRGATK